MNKTAKKTIPPKCTDGYLERILNAHVYDVARETPLELARGLSQRQGNQIWLKREDEQSVFSFKVRGAYNKIAQLDRSQLDRGVVTASAGNHAQGVALAAEKVGCKAVVVMPVTTPRIKINAVRRFGAKVVLHGDSYSDAQQHASELEASEGMTLIHPYDDPEVIAGQGTIGMEILRQHTRPIDAIFIPIGGGGLAAGIAVYVKRLRPEIKVIGVEPVDSNAMSRSIKAGRRLQLAQVGLFADGVAVKQVGSETFRLCRQLLDEIVCVNTDAMCAAIKDGFEDTRAILEPAGALAIAGAKAWIKQQGAQGQTFVVLTTGANMNFDRLRFVAEVAEIGEAREAILACRIPERPGSFKAFCRLIGRRPITEFNYRYHDPAAAHVFVGLEVDSREEAGRLIEELRTNDIETLDLSDNDIAKQHIRHLVGGHAQGVEHEIVYRFEFPERPGALLEFLNALSRGWNITMFHHRNHGADYGRVLAALDLPASEKSKFEDVLKSLGYRFSDETRNPAWQLFLA